MHDAKPVMDRNDLVRDTYAHYGLAMYNAQLLEHGIVSAMVVAKMPDRNHITRSDIDGFMGRQFEKTLGALLRELTTYVAVPADLVENLAKALRIRNHLAHEYFRERAATFMTNRGCLEMIEELESWQAFLLDVEHRLRAIVRPIGERFGITDDVIAAEAQKMLEQAASIPH
jgi:hypothetical protein